MEDNDDNILKQYISERLTHVPLLDTAEGSPGQEEYERNGMAPIDDSMVLVPQISSQQDLYEVLSGTDQLHKV
jgi:hypothetical protein